MIDLNSLLADMTVREKAGQLTQVVPAFFLREEAGEITGPRNSRQIDDGELFLVGSVLGLDSPRDMAEIQREYLKRSRHPIPLLFMADVIHGYRTVFPVPLGLGCTWDAGLLEETARIAAKEASVSGNHVTFSPMADLVRDPRWGRVVEATGEDTWLNSQYASALVKGYQGDTGPEHIAACVKHFAAYGAAEGGRDYNTADMSDRTLREDYLPAYRAAVEAGAMLVMTSFNTVHGIPATASSYLLRDILRDEWGFSGVVISDWTAVEELIAHGVARDGMEAAEKALKAGVDIEMMSFNYLHYLPRLIEEGRVEERLLDEAVMRILRLKEKLGLFENPYRSVNARSASSICGCQKHRQKAREAAAKSMVLLKNEGILPLTPGQKIAVIGPYAQSDRLLGPWTIQGKWEETVTLAEGLRRRNGAEHVIIAKGCEMEGTIAAKSTDAKEAYTTYSREAGFEEATAAAQAADVIILALGEPEEFSGEAGSRTRLTLPGDQEELIFRLARLKKPMAAVLFNGRPLELTGWLDQVPAVIEAWFPGSEAGSALADVLFGDYNPSGRLSMSFPYTVGQIPVYYDHYSTGRPVNLNPEEPRYVSRYLDAPNEPLFPFGYGLSYTKYEYSGLRLSSPSLLPGNSITLSLEVKNAGSKEGLETVQLYIRDHCGTAVRPVKELKGCSQIKLQPNETKTVRFEITGEMLRYLQPSGEFRAEPGKFTAMAGHDSESLMKADFMLLG